MLVAILVADLAQKTKLRNERRAEEERLQNIRNEQFKQQLKKLKTEEEKIKNLFVEIENYNKSLLIRNYIESIEEKMKLETNFAEKSAEHEKWKNGIIISQIV